MQCRPWWLTCVVMALVAGTGAAQDARLVYISNVIGTEAGGRKLTTIEEQTGEMFSRLGTLLQERGLGLADVVAANVFLKDARQFQAMNQVYRGKFGAALPTRATVQADLPDADALIQMSVIATRAEKEIVRPAQLKSPELPYSWGIKVGPTLFISGATSRDPGTYEPVSGDVATQTRRVLGNAGIVLAAAGMGPRDLVSCRVFLGDPRRFGDLNRAYAEFMPPDDPPARATVRAGLTNPAFDVEIQCIAEASANRRVVVGEGRQRSRAPLSPGILTENRLYLSGMVGSGPQGTPADVAGQARASLDNLGATLSAAGMGFGNVVNTWVYLADVRHWEAVKGVLAEVLPRTMPSPTVIGTPLMGSNLLVEIEMVAQR